MIVWALRQFVCQIRQTKNVGQSRRSHSSAASPCWLGLVLLMLAAVGGCGQHPDELIVGRWKELDWRYEKLDGFAPERSRWMDGVRFPAFEGGVVRHEAEYWDFLPDHTLVISKRDGTTLRVRWHLKGRGHVLTLHSLTGEELELYDVKELDPDRLILNFDIGMEVRGIAQLSFGRTPLPPAAFADNRGATTPE